MASTPTNGDDVIFGTDANNTINALGGDDLIFGGLGDDVLQGSTGNDQLSGGIGLDLLVGGSGLDTAFYGFSSDAIFADLNDGFGYVVALGQGADKDLFFSIENLAGGFGNDDLRGNASANKISGNSGNDQINGFEGNDTLTGGNGNDFISGGDGNDNIDGGAGDDQIRGGSGGDVMAGGSGVDTLDYGGFGSAVTILLSSGSASGGDAGGDVISGFENAIGSQFDDHLSGTRGANLIQGGEGGDTISGFAGADHLRGQNGDDIILGGSGNDLIVGQAGVDILTGGTGEDRFFFENIADSGLAPALRDVITDFAQGSDRIEVFGIDANEATVADESFTFIGTADFTSGVAGEVRYAHLNGTTIISFRTGVAGAADMRIVLDDLVDLTAADFLL